MTLDKNLVKQLIAQIEAEIDEPLKLLTLLRKQLGENTPPSAISVDKKVETVSSANKATPTYKHNYRLNGSSDPNFVPIATRAVNVLRVAGRPLQLREIVAELSRLGLDTSKKNFSTSLYTAMTRRSSELYKNANGEWSLVESKQETTQPTMNYESDGAA